MTHAAYIGRITVRSESPYIVYGEVRGLVSEHKTLADAQKSADKDARDCRKARKDYYSDAHVYEWNEEQGWIFAACDDETEGDDE